MDNRQCKNCSHFLQHYTLGTNRLLEVYCGHCTYPRAKRKRPDSKACENYMPYQPLEDVFVSKEYLSKALLQKVLNMELLPEIERKG